MRVWWLFLALFLAGCGKSVPPRVTELDKSIQKAQVYLKNQQSDKGAWASHKYDVYKDGYSLTPLVAMALHGAQLEPEAVKKSLVFMSGMSDEARDKMLFPIYSLAATATVAPPGPLLDSCVTYVRSRQLTEQLEWKPTDLAYGSWGEAISPYHRPAGSGKADGTKVGNLSNTLWSLEALRAAGVEASDPSIVKALGFVKRCQNYGTGSKDGGFFFCPTHENRNKAGGFNSYGSTTADGIRALLACGLPVDDPHVKAAKAWLIKNWSSQNNAGDFPARRTRVRDSLFYYYVSSGATALRATWTPEDDPAWARDLADELMSRQQADGSFANEVSVMTEDEPLVATPLALTAMVCARDVLLKAGK